MRRPGLIYAVYITVCESEAQASVNVANGVRLQRLDAVTPHPAGVALAQRYFFSQKATLPGFALTHVSAALSGFIFLPAIRLATVFWSFDVHLNLLTTATAGEPLFANLLLITLSRTVGG